MLALFSNFIQVHRKRRLTKHLSSNIGKRIAKLIFILALLVCLNSLAMIAFEKMQLNDAIWLSFTTLVTVGYGDFSPSSLPGRLSTIITMYGFAITMLSLLAAEVIEWRLSITEKKRRGLWEFKDMSDHIQIINTPNTDTETYLRRLITEIQKTSSLSDLPIQLLTRKYPDGLPPSLSELKLLHRTGTAEDGVIIHKINLEKAKHVVILARDASDSISDSVTFDILSQALDINPKANIVVEVVLDENRARFLKMGASAVLRPIRAYPEVVARALSNPGTERVLEDLFQAHGDSIHKIDCSFKETKWSQIISTCVELNIGTPLAYFDAGKVCVQPEFNAPCSGDGLAILIKDNKSITIKDLQTKLT